MSERIEEVELIDGTKKEIKIGFISYQEQRKILSNHIEFGIKGGELDIKKIDYFNLQPAVLKAANVPVDKIKDSEGDKLFNKYFSNLIKGIGGDSEKNLEMTSE